MDHIIIIITDHIIMDMVIIVIITGMDIDIEEIIINTNKIFVKYLDNKYRMEPLMTIDN